MGAEENYLLLGLRKPTSTPNDDDLKAIHTDRDNKYAHGNPKLDKSKFIKHQNAAKHDPDKGNKMYDADFPTFKYNYHISIAAVSIDASKNYSILYGDSLPVG